MKPLMSFIIWKQFIQIQTPPSIIIMISCQNNPWQSLQTFSTRARKEKNDTFSPALMVHDDIFKIVPRFLQGDSLQFITEAEASSPSLLQTASSCFCCCWWCNMQLAPRISSNMCGCQYHIAQSCNFKIASQTQ